MREVLEFRIVEEFADHLFEPTEGKKLGNNSIRLVEVEAHDPRLKEIGQIQRQLDLERGELFFTSWDVKRRYSTKELESAELFHLTIDAVFEPAGEECGTAYDDSGACPHCGAGRVQTSDLKLDLRKVPKRKDMAATIANEWSVSELLAGYISEARIDGFTLRPVRHISHLDDDPLDLETVPTGRRLLQRGQEAGLPHPTPAFWIWLNKPEQRRLLDTAFRERRALSTDSNKPIRPIYYQLIPISTSLRIIPPTRIGIDPFDEDSKGEYRCPLGHVIGLNPLSEIYIDRSSYDGSDIAFTREMVGIRRGLLRPGPLILISPRLRNLLVEKGVKGFKTDIAHLM